MSGLKIQKKNSSNDLLDLIKLLNKELNNLGLTKNEIESHVLKVKTKLMMMIMKRTQKKLN